MISISQKTSKKRKSSRKAEPVEEPTQEPEAELPEVSEVEPLEAAEVFGFES